MRLLLDTHIFLWSISDDDRLSAKARAAITDRSNTVLVSTASTWEIAMKWRAGKLELPLSPEEILSTGVARSNFTIVPMDFGHTLAAANLPSHHRDPFDRMLIAQAILENATLVTLDKKIKRYKVPILR